MEKSLNAPPQSPGAVWPVWPVWTLKDLPSPNSPDGAVDDEPGPDDGAGRLLVCRACGHRVANASSIMREAEGGRVFCNPHGLLFEIIRVKSAPGCVFAGPAVREFSWFPGYAWRIALCGTCGAHLGWRFEGESVFFGLIESTLEEIGE